MTGLRFRRGSAVLDRRMIIQLNLGSCPTRNTAQRLGGLGMTRKESGCSSYIRLMPMWGTRPTALRARSIWLPLETGCIAGAPAAEEQAQMLEAEIDYRRGEERQDL